MKLSTSLVAVKKITSKQSRSDFADDAIEKAAHLILESEGIINPIIVRRTSLQSYEVVDGDFEYYAAARAREIDLRKGEMIGVFIIEAENEEALNKQVQLFRKSKSVISKQHISSKIDSNESISTNTEIRLTNTESRMNNIESRFENRITELQTEFRNENKKLNEKLNEIEKRIPKEIKPLEALNELDVSQLTSKLTRVSIKEKEKLILLIINERKNGNFTSFSNFFERIKSLGVKGLGDKTMLKIIDSFT